MESMRRFARWTVCGGFILWPFWILSAGWCGLYDHERAIVEFASFGAVALVLAWVYLDIRRYRQERELRELFDLRDERDDFGFGATGGFESHQDSR